MCELGVEPQHADDQQYKENVRLYDAREKTLSRRKVERNRRSVLQCQRRFCSVKPCYPAAIQLTEKIFGRGRDQIDEPAIQCLVLRKRLCVRHGGFRERWIAAALLGVAPQKSHSVVENFSAHGLVDLQLKSADCDDRRRRASVCRGSHRRNVRGKKDEETS